MPNSLKHLPRREAIAIVIVTATIMAAVIALAAKLGFAPLLIV